jgi:hypothetical protein
MTYEWDDILIIGDSFCADRSMQYHWPQIVTTRITDQQYNGTISPRGRGFPGASWWSGRKNLLTELELRVPKVLILCHTEPYRIPHDTDWGLNTRSVAHNIVYVPPDSTDKPSKEFINAATAYYEYIISEDYHKWAYQQWFLEVDRIIDQYQMIEKVVHFFCFKGPHCDHVFKNGVTMEVPLIEYQKLPVWRVRDEAPNHYSKIDNLKFGIKLSDIIKNYPGNGVRLNTKLIGK